MAVYKEEKTNTWRVLYRYTDWNGERKQSQKRGFKTKREAQAWEREQFNKLGGDLDMTFKSFVQHYTEDNIANQDASGHCTTFLKSVLDVDNLSLFDVKQKIARILFPNGTESQEATEKLEVILNLEIPICESWHRFIKRETNGDVVYHTYHGTKGLEFDNVIIIMGNAFGRERNYFDFYFSHCQCQNALNDKDKEKMTRVKNLLYVSVTRAIKNLRVLYVDETTNFNQGIKTIFGEIHSFSI